MDGRCEICGEYCASDSDDDGATAEYHYRLTERRHACEEGHLGPWHDRRGRPLPTCGWCAEVAEYFGEDDSLDHSDCRRCRAERPQLPLPAPRGWSRRPGLQLEPRMPVPGELHRDDAQGVGQRLAAGLNSTEPADRRRAEHALRTFLGRKSVRFEWYDSPRVLGERFAAAVEAGGLELPLSPAELEPWSLWLMAPARLRERVEWDHHVLGGTARQIANDVAERVGAIAAAAEDLARPPGTQVPPPFSASGQFDVVSRRQDLIDGLGDVPPIADGGFLALMAELRLACGPVLYFDRAFHILDRPLVLRLDAETRLHCDHGPALAYPDGSEVWAVHGVVVPRHVVLHPELIRAEDIAAEANAEVRRVLVERFGAERLIREGGAELVDEGPMGKLWRWSPARSVAWRAEPLQMVEVVNATAEPDGSFRTYFLRVPPTVRTAHEAVAWTFRVKPDQYHPAQQT